MRMSEQATRTVTEDQFKKFEKFMAQAEKQKRYQQVLNAKVTLQAKWARLNKCPITKKHAEFFADLDSEVRDTLTIEQIMSMADTREDGVEATAQAVDTMRESKKEGTEEPSLDDETEEEEPSA